MLGSPCSCFTRFRQTVSGYDDVGALHERLAQCREHLLKMPGLDNAVGERGVVSLGGNPALDEGEGMLVVLTLVRSNNSQPSAARLRLRPSVSSVASMPS
jgi:hypothetical protein